MRRFMDHCVCSSWAKRECVASVPALSTHCASTWERSHDGPPLKLRLGRGRHETLGSTSVDHEPSSATVGLTEIDQNHGLRPLVSK